MKIIHTDTAGDFLSYFAGNRFFIYPILDNQDLHWTKQTVIGVYYRDILSRNEFYINLGHYDMKISEFNRTQLYAKYDDVVFKSKCFGGVDAELLYWIHTQKKLPVLSSTPLRTILRPIYQIFEHCREVFDLAMHLPVTDAVHNYCNLQADLSKIETNGLQTLQGLVHSEYNLTTLTGRPSNTFGGINFAALNKTDSTRKQFISRFENGWLVEYDYHAYHIHLLAKIFNYKFADPENVYLELASELNIDPENIKQEVFHQIYGGINPKYFSHPLFKKIHEFTETLNPQDYKSVLFSKPMPPVENRVKSLNYLLQNLETEMNSFILCEVNRFLENFETKLILYTYDSFLFDYSPIDTPGIFFQLEHILEKQGIPTRFKIGRNYHTMFDKKLNQKHLTTN